MNRHTFALAPALLSGIFFLARPAEAQEKKCNVICSPVFLFQPGTFTANLFDPPAVRRLSDGAVFELDTETDFLMNFALVAPTTIPRTNLFLLLGWTPWADAPLNPFTGRSAKDLGEEEIDANPLFMLYGPLFDLVTTEETNGWFASTFDVLGLFSPAAEPDDERFYTHKFVLELHVLLGIFNWLPKGNWLRNFTAYGFLDYVATGLPDRGDVVGGLEFLDDADPWIILAGIHFPIAPLGR